MQRPIVLCLALLVLASSMILGCGGAAEVAVRREFRVDFTPDQRSRLVAEANAPYRIQKGDILAVRDLYNEELDQEAIRVLPDGTATFLALERLDVAGMSIGELDSILTAGYGTRFRDPLVDVYVQEFGPRKVYVLGEVRAPGAYEYEGDAFNVISAVAAAGGYDDFGDQGSVAIIRIDADGYRCREVDLAAMTRGEVFDPAALDLRPFDIVYVSRTGIGDFVEFTESFVGALLNYTNIATDIRYLSDENIYRR